MLRWIGKIDAQPEEFYVFGDSEPDLQIGEELYAQNKRFKFIYTGNKELGTYPFEIIKTRELYDLGTLEYLLSE